MRSQRQSGQVLVLFALGFTALLALGALAIDLSTVYSIQRAERAAADAAALAGAQQLQIPGSRSIDATHVTAARADALAVLEARFGASGTAVSTASGSTCATSVDLIDCALVGTPYWVSIRTPSAIALDVDTSRAVEVSVRNPTVGLSLSRLFGQTGWNVGETSVAGITYSGQYAVITLRPPQSGRIGNYGDITINGTGSAVQAVNGDIGNNTTDTLNGHTATVAVSDGFYVRYYGDTSNMQYSTPPGPGALRQLAAPIPDPNYLIPVQGSTAVGGSQAFGTCKTTAAYAAAVANGYPTPTECYTPGVYSGALTVKNGGTALLQPGVYFLNGGVVLKGSLIGGTEGGQPGVALVLPYTQTFTLNGTPPLLALNRGSAYNTGVGTEATAALFGGSPVQTTTTPPMVMSVLVTRSAACETVVFPAVTIDGTAPASCGTTIDWTGSGGKTTVAVSGVIYGPTDSMAIAGGNDLVRGYVGQTVAWTITYSGGSILNQHFPGGTSNGVLRLDRACSGGDSPC